jgi:hypothetical protein
MAVGVLENRFRKIDTEKRVRLGEAPLPPAAAGFRIPVALPTSRYLFSGAISRGSDPALRCVCLSAVAPPRLQCPRSRNPRRIRCEISPEEHL